MSIKNDAQRFIESGGNPLDILGDFLGDAVNRKSRDVIMGDEVAFHDSHQMLFPRGTTFSGAIKTLERLRDEAETPTAFSRKFLYRPDDGAYATFQVIKSLFGMTLGKSIETFFGTIPAEKRTIKIGVDQTMQVPWGNMELPSMPGLTINIGSTLDEDYGTVFYIYANGPKKFQDDMQSLFEGVEEYLKTNSIYRGRAILGSDQPDFLDLSKFDRDKIVFSEEVEAVLEGTIWSPLRYSEAMRKDGIPLKRAILLEGPFGTGKSSTGLITAEVAVDNGWTFISAKPGKDKVEDVLRTARLYQPSVVFVEDIDGATSSGEHDDVTKFLDAFDGISSKGGELIAVMTTNHLERIHKGMLRPGRLDAVIHIAELDRPGIEKLIKVIVPTEKLDTAVDYDKVAEAMNVDTEDAFLPAFISEAIKRAMTLALSNNKGRGDYTISTDDLVYAAHSLHPQLAALNDAGEGERRPTLDTVFRHAVAGAVIDNVQTYDGYNDQYVAPKQGEK